ncbi:S1C family serine protease [Streptomyces sp. NPDC088348]|uniref:S1C family serine protease n=1 Tax=Streptomyces sp. NPDC088348 TaxID=3365853 RepID=UPI0037F60066
MDDGRPTGPDANGWSRPTPPRTAARPAPEPPALLSPEPLSPEPENPGPPSQPPEPPAPARTPASGTQAAHLTGEAPAGRPRALHDLDPYGTPPCGGPGPWAPAPPVQQSPQWLRYDPWGTPPSPPSPPVREAIGEKGHRRRAVVVMVVVALITGVIGGGLGAYSVLNGSFSDVRLPQAGRESPARAPGTVAGIAASALPSVVTLHVRGGDEADTGTGFVLDREGRILTNNHVVEPAGSAGDITVTFSGGESAKARVVGRDSGYDLAVVQVTGVSGLTPLPLGNSDNVQVGDPVVAIGAPFDLADTVTSGIISAKDRPITSGGGKNDGSDVSYVDALQTDAPINPGNSGGPLVDSKARVIGINSAIRAADDSSDTEGGQGGQGGSIGLGFAIPINQAKRVAEELINNGRAAHPVIGVTLDMKYAGDGARVAARANDGGPAVAPGGPGAAAGIEPGDIVTGVDGEQVHSAQDLIVRIRAHRPGDRLALTVRRDGRVRPVTLSLGSADGT